MRAIFLAAAVMLPSVAAYGQDRDATNNPFRSSQGEADEASPRGAVTFAFDGGTLLCTFGRGKADEKRAVAMIVVPATVKRLIADNRLAPATDTQGSTVLIVKPNGDRVPLGKDAVRDWAADRIQEMGTRESSVEEHAFVAAVVHTLTTGEHVRCWGHMGQDALEAGKWGCLFTKSQEVKPRNPDADPFD